MGARARRAPPARTRARGDITRTMRMLVDARHPEETRVAVVKGNRIEEFDFESAEHKQLKGNIYLAKVTRVEPSLQAAFIDYGGNRHGFLAFSEIHPDYYQIPKADRDALLREEAEQAAEEEKLRNADADRRDAAEEAAPADTGADEGEYEDGDNGRGGGGGGKARQPRRRPPRRGRRGGAGGYRCRRGGVRERRQRPQRRGRRRR